MIGFDYDDWFNDVFRATDGSAVYAGETGQESEAWQESFRAELRDVLGFPAVHDNAVGDIDLRRREHPEVTVRHRSYKRRTRSVHTEQGFRVPFYLLLPDSVDPSYPVAVAPHDHTEHGKDPVIGAAEDEAAGRHIAGDRRDMARQAVRWDFAVVAPDMHAFGELSPDASGGSGSSDAISARTR